MKSLKRENTDTVVEFKMPEVEDGLCNAQIGLMVNLGKHKQLPRFVKEKDKVMLDDDGNPKINLGLDKDGNPKLESKLSVYIDLLEQTHDYEGDIGVRNIRLPFHQVQYGVSQGINYTMVAPRDAEGNYIKNRKWTLAPASKWAALSKAILQEQTATSKTMHDIIFDPASKNANAVWLMVGKPFNITVEVKETTKGDKTYKNVNVKTPVALAKKEIGKTESPLQPAVVVDMKDDDLLTEYEFTKPDGETFTYRKIDLLRKADLLKIVLAEDYKGSPMQKAIQEEHNEEALIKDAKEKQQKVIDNDKELKQVMEILNKQNGVEPESSDGDEPPATTSDREPDYSDMDTDMPF